MLKKFKVSAKSGTHGTEQAALAFWLSNLKHKYCKKYNILKCPGKVYVP